MKAHHVKKAVHLGLAFVTLLFIVSGYGITEYRIVEAATFGILDKNVSFRVHSFLTIPFIALVAAHMYLTLGHRFRRE